MTVFCTAVGSSFGHGMLCNYCRAALHYTAYVHVYEHVVVCMYCMWVYSYTQYTLASTCSTTHTHTLLVHSAPHSKMYTTNFTHFSVFFLVRVSCLIAAVL